MKYALLVWCCLVWGAAAPEHPMKMSVCDLQYRSEKGHLSLKFRFFLDDLTTALEKQTGRSLSLAQPCPENDQVLAIFINRHFKLNINGVSVKPRLYRTVVDDVVLVLECIGEGFRPSPTYTVQLSNQFLLDVYPSQYNLARFDFFGNGNWETLRFEKAERYLERTIRP